MGIPPAPLINPNWNLSVSVTIKNKNSPPAPDQKYSRKFFDTAVLNGVDDDNDDYGDNKYRLPPVFDRDLPENGKYILSAGDKTFAEAGRYEEDAYVSDDDDRLFHLPSLSDGRNIISIEDRPDPTARSPVRPTKHRHSKKKGKREEVDIVIPGDEPVKTLMDDMYGDDFEDDDDDDEGTLKYNHRDEFSSVPNEGLEMAPSRDTSKLGRRRSSQLNDAPPAMTIQKIGSGELWCQCSNVDLSTLKCDECSAVGGHEKWCTYARSASRHGKCPKCGKHVRKTQPESKPEPKRKHSTSFTRKMSRTTTKEDSDIPRKRPFSDTPAMTGKGSGLRVRFEDDTHAEKHADSAKSKTVADEDYKAYSKAYEDFVYNREGWANTPDYSEDEDFEDYPLKEYPRVDPNIHRDAYYKAIAARSLEKMKKLDEVDESFASERISKPHVFSYFKLRPHQKNALPGGPDNIGIMPSESVNVRPRKAMQHIFGKIKVDDFYPGGKKNKSQVSVSYIKEKHKQTMPINKWTRGGLNG